MLKRRRAGKKNKKKIKKDGPQLDNLTRKRKEKKKKNDRLEETPVRSECHCQDYSQLFRAKDSDVDPNGASSSVCSGSEFIYY